MPIFRKNADRAPGLRIESRYRPPIRCFARVNALSQEELAGALIRPWECRTACRIKLWVRMKWGAAHFTKIRNSGEEGECRCTSNRLGELTGLC